MKLPDGVTVRHTPEHTIVVPETWELDIRGERLPLIGNTSTTQRRQMIAAILDARGLR